MGAMAPMRCADERHLLVSGEVSCGPVEERNVELVDGLGVGAGQGPRSPAVKAAVEAEDGEIGRTWCLDRENWIAFRGSGSGSSAKTLNIRPIV